MTDTPGYGGYGYGASGQSAREQADPLIAGRNRLRRIQQEAQEYKQERAVYEEQERRRSPYRERLRRISNQMMTAAEDPNRVFSLNNNEAFGLMRLGRDRSERTFWEAVSTNAAGQEKGFWGYMPFAGTLAEGSDQDALEEASKRINAGTGSREDYDRLAAFLNWSERGMGGAGIAGAISGELFSFMGETWGVGALGKVIKFGAGVARAGSFGTRAKSVADAAALVATRTRQSAAFQVPRMLARDTGRAVMGDAAARNLARMAGVPVRAMGTGLGQTVGKEAISNALSLFGDTQRSRTINAAHLAYLQDKYQYDASVFGVGVAVDDSVELFRYLPKAFVDQFIENWSEATGATLTEGLSLMNKVAKIKFMDDLLAKRLGKGKSMAQRRMWEATQKVGWDGIIEEGFEEVMGAGAKQVLGWTGAGTFELDGYGQVFVGGEEWSEEYKQWLDYDQWWGMALGLALGGGTTATIAAGLQRAVDATDPSRFFKRLSREGERLRAELGAANGRAQVREAMGAGDRANVPAVNEEAEARRLLMGQVQQKLLREEAEARGVGVDELTDDDKLTIINRNADKLTEEADDGLAEWRSLDEAGRAKQLEEWRSFDTPIIERVAEEEEAPAEGEAPEVAAPAEGAPAEAAPAAPAPAPVAAREGELVLFDEDPQKPGELAPAAVERDREIYEENRRPELGRQGDALGVGTASYDELTPHQQRLVNMHQRQGVKVLFRKGGEGRAAAMTRADGTIVYSIEGTMQNTTARGLDGQGRPVDQALTGQAALDSHFLHEAVHRLVQKYGKQWLDFMARNLDRVMPGIRAENAEQYTQNWKAFQDAEVAAGRQRPADLTEQELYEESVSRTLEMMFPYLGALAKANNTQQLEKLISQGVTQRGFWGRVWDAMRAALSVIPGVGEPRLESMKFLREAIEGVDNLTEQELAGQAAIVQEFANAWIGAGVEVGQEVNNLLSWQKGLQGEREAAPAPEEAAQAPEPAPAAEVAPEPQAAPEPAAAPEVTPEPQPAATPADRPAARALREANEELEAIRRKGKKSTVADRKRKKELEEQIIDLEIAALNEAADAREAAPAPAPAPEPAPAPAPEAAPEAEAPLGIDAQFADLAQRQEALDERMERLEEQRAELEGMPEGERPDNWSRRMSALKGRETRALKEQLAIDEELDRLQQLEAEAARKGTVGDDGNARYNIGLVQPLMQGALSDEVRTQIREDLLSARVTTNILSGDLLDPNLSLEEQADALVQDLEGSLESSFHLNDLLQKSRTGSYAEESEFRDASKQVPSIASGEVQPAAEVMLSYLQTSRKALRDALSALNLSINHARDYVDPSLISDDVITDLRLLDFVRLPQAQNTRTDRDLLREDLKKGQDAIAIASVVRQHFGSLAGIHQRFREGMKSLASVARSTMQAMDPVEDLDLVRLVNAMEYDRRNWGALLADKAAQDPATAAQLQELGADEEVLYRYPWDVFSGASLSKDIRKAEVTETNLHQRIDLMRDALPKSSLDLVGDVLRDLEALELVTPDGASSRDLLAKTLKSVAAVFEQEDVDGYALTVDELMVLDLERYLERTPSFQLQERRYRHAYILSSLIAGQAPRLMTPTALRTITRLSFDLVQDDVSFGSRVAVPFLSAAATEVADAAQRERNIERFFNGYDTERDLVTNLPLVAAHLTTGRFARFRAAGRRGKDYAMVSFDPMYLADRGTRGYIRNKKSNIGSELQQKSIANTQPQQLFLLARWRKRYDHGNNRADMHPDAGPTVFDGSGIATYGLQNVLQAAAHMVYGNGYESQGKPLEQAARNANDLVNDSEIAWLHRILVTAQRVLKSRDQSRMGARLGLFEADGSEIPIPSLEEVRASGKVITGNKLTGFKAGPALQDVAATGQASPLLRLLHMAYQFTLDADGDLRREGEKANAGSVLSGGAPISALGIGNDRDLKGFYTTSKGFSSQLAMPLDSSLGLEPAKWDLIEQQWFIDTLIQRGYDAFTAAEGASGPLAKQVESQFKATSEYKGGLTFATAVHTALLQPNSQLVSLVNRGKYKAGLDEQEAEAQALYNIQGGLDSGYASAPFGGKRSKLDMQGAPSRAGGVGFSQEINDPRVRRRTTGFVDFGDDVGGAMFHADTVRDDMSAGRFEVTSPEVPAEHRRKYSQDVAHHAMRTGAQTVSFLEAELADAFGEMVGAKPIERAGRYEIDLKPTMYEKAGPQYNYGAQLAFRDRMEMATGARLFEDSDARFNINPDKADVPAPDSARDSVMVDYRKVNAYLDFYLGRLDKSYHAVQLRGKKYEDRLIALMPEELKGKAFAKRNWVGRMDRAMHLWIDLSGSESGKGVEQLLREFEQQAADKGMDLTSRQAETIRDVRNMPREVRFMAEELATHNHMLGTALANAGMINEGRRYYTARIWFMDSAELALQNLTSEIGFGMGQSLDPTKAGVRFRRGLGARAKARTYDNILEGWLDGRELNIDRALVAQEKVHSDAMEALATNVLLKQLESIGAVYLAPTKMRPRRGVKMRAPGNMTRVISNAPTMDGVWAVPELANELSALTNVFQPGEFLRTVYKIQAVTKSTLLFTSLFHHQAFMRSYYYSLPLQGAGAEASALGDLFWASAASVTSLFSQDQATRVLMKSKGAREGYNAIMSMSPELDDLVDAGLTVAIGMDYAAKADMDSDWRKTWMERAIARGETGRRWSEALADHRIETSNWLFNKLGNSLKAQAALMEYRHMLFKNADALANGQITKARIAEIVAAKTNDDFGGLNLRRRRHTFGAGPRRSGWQFFLRMAMLAPDWTESNFNTMAKIVFPTSAGKDIESPMSAKQRSLERGAYASLYAKSILRAQIPTQIFNIMMAGFDPDEDVEEMYARMLEKPEKLAFLKADVTVVARAINQMFGPREKQRYEHPDTRYYFNTMGHFLDPVKWVLGLGYDTMGPLKAKGSPLVRAGLSLVSGRNWRGQVYTNAWPTEDQGDKELLWDGTTASWDFQYSLGLPPRKVLSFLADQILGSAPIFGQSLAGFAIGEDTAFTALADSFGAHMTKIDGEQLEKARARGDFVIGRAR